MTDSLSLILITSVAPIITYGIYSFFVKFQNKKSQGIIVKNKRGRREIIFIPTGLDRSRIEKIINLHLEFENKIEEDLKRIKNTNIISDYTYDKNIDFLLKCHDEILGLEAKLNINYLNIQEINKLKSKSKSKKIIYVYKKSEVAKDKLDKLSEDNKNISFLKFNDDAQFKKDLIRNIENIKNVIV